MVMAGILIEESKLHELKKMGVKDSKLLAHSKRKELFKKIVLMAKEYSIIIIEPWEVDEALNSKKLNLNWLEAHKSAQIINGLKPERVVIDSPSNNVVKYKAYLMDLLDNKKIKAVVEHKADVNHVECSAASILAKVTREDEVEKLKKKYGDFGSGYLTDPLTIKFMKENFEKHPEIFRKTWAPYKELVNGKNQKNLSDFGEVEK
ncbi:ribonuclease HII [Candidatus Woesearchaeota archaeon]|nr:ribonuclease HII [Candidatus Woesearchaeota archaeon]